MTCVFEFVSLFIRTLGSILSCVLCVSLLGAAVRLDECELPTSPANDYEQIVWPAQRRMHILWRSNGTSFQWRGFTHALLDLTPATLLISSAWQGYRGVAWPSQGQINFFHSIASDLSKWESDKIDHPDVNSSTTLAGGGLSRYHQISWAGQGKLHVLFRARGDDWQNWERLEYDKTLVLEDLTPDTAVTTIIADNHHAVVWPGHGKLHYFYEDANEWDVWKTDKMGYADLTPSTVLGSDGTHSFRLIAWPAEGKLHMLVMGEETQFQWQKWEKNIWLESETYALQPLGPPMSFDLSPSTRLTVIVSNRVRGIYWSGRQQIHGYEQYFKEKEEQWGTWKYSMVYAEPSMSVNTRIAGAGVADQGVQNIVAPYMSLLIAASILIQHL